VSRVYFVTDTRGARRIDDLQAPLSLGGSGVADVVLPGTPADLVAAWVALSDGHAYLQPAAGDRALFHNHRQIRNSVWLKSGDQVQVGDAVLHWTVRGDQVHIDVSEGRPQPSAPAPVTAALQPPVDRPPLPGNGTAPHAGRHRTMKRTLALALGVLALVAGFVLVATPIEISIRPPPEVQQLSGFPPPLPLGKRLLVWPGRYRLQASLAGYRPLDEVLDISMGGFRRFELSLREMPGEVVLEVQPPVSYRLQVDSEPVDVDSHGVVHIERGRHLLRIESERYLPAQQQIDVAGLGKLQQVGFTLAPAWAEVRIDSRPAGARVLVDGQPVGSTPLAAELLQGEHSITLQMPLFKPLTLSQTVVAGAPLALDTLVLEPADGQVMLDSIPGSATVQVDGDYRGTTPTLLTLGSAREHRLQLSKPGYATLEQALRVQPEEQQTLKLKLDAQYGTLFVTSVPADAELRVDGEPLGRATRRLRLSTRPHRLEIHRPGYVSELLTVTPRAGVSQNIDVSLQTPQQAKQASVTETLQAGDGQVLRLVRPTQPFTLGASRREAGRRANESARLVQLTRAFYFGDTEVTNAQYRVFKPSHTSGSAEGASLDGPEQPVVNISWDDAARYCNWLSKRQGLPAAYREVQGHMQLIRPVTTGYRLPTEVEWAYVARLLGRTAADRYPWEGGFPPKQVVGNFADARISDTLAQALPDYDDSFRVSAPVGSFAAWPKGFHDLAGNVAEWMSDYYAVYPGQAERLVKDPLGPDSGEHHVVRGSSWRQGNITELRLSYRDYSREPRADLGFRLARYVE
jgi:formylglycine-generating enzyme required for sulfatase activity